MKDTDFHYVASRPDTDGTVTVALHGDRRYKLNLKPEEILGFLLKAPTSAIADAVANVKDKEKLPEIIKQIVVGLSKDT